MLKKSLFLLQLLLLLGAGSVRATGIHFEHGTYAEALEKARTEQKLLFVDAYAVWCGPCKWMAANAFMDESVGAFFDEHFIAYKYDMEKGDGPAFASKYKVNAYPTLFFLNGDGSVALQKTGALDSEGLLEVARKALAQAPARKVVPTPDPEISPRKSTEPSVRPVPQPEGGRAPSANREKLVENLRLAIEEGDVDVFMAAGEDLLDSDDPDRDWLYVLANQTWLENGGDTAIFVENLFFWAEMRGPEDGEALRLAGDLIHQTVEDPSIRGFADLWEEEASEMLAMKEFDGNDVPSEDEEFEAWEESLPGENALPDDSRPVEVEIWGEE